MQASVPPLYQTSFLRIQPHGSRPRLYVLPGMAGETSFVRPILPHLLPDQPVYGIQPGSEARADPTYRPIEAVAARYAEDLCSFQPEGPYCLAGYSFGGVVAYEMARQLASRGKSVNLLAILDTGPRRRFEPSAAGLFYATYRFACDLVWWVRHDLVSTRPKKLWEKMARRARGMFRLLGSGSDDSARPSDEYVFDFKNLPDRYRQQAEQNLLALFNYVPGPYPGRVTLFRARSQPLNRLFPKDKGWGKCAVGGVDVRTVSGTHGTMLHEPFVRGLANSLQAALEEAARKRMT